MPVGKDPGDRHFMISVAKSATRILGCILGVMFQSITVMGFMFLAAEVLGILEEL